MQYWFTAAFLRQSQLLGMHYPTVSFFDIIHMLIMLINATCLKDDEMMAHDGTISL